MQKVIKRCLLLLSITSVAFSAPSFLEGTTWVYPELREEFRVPVVFEDGTMRAFFPCFTVQGDYTVSGTTTGGLQIQIRQIDSTCGEDRPYEMYNEEYQNFFSSLEKLTQFRISADGVLHLFTSDNDTFELEKSDEPPLFPDEILGRWFLVSSGRYLYFWSNGQYELYDGCNTNWGTYRVTADSLYFEFTMGTLRACDGSLVTIERPSSGAYSMNDDTLIITDQYKTYRYSRVKPVPLQSVVPKSNYHNSAAMPREDVLFNCQGRAIQGIKGKKCTGLRTGIYFRRRSGADGVSVQVMTDPER